MGSRQSRLAKWSMRYPTVADLVEPARRRIPYFAFDFLKGGTGDELSCERNYRAIREVELAPRYGGPISSVDIRATMFGRELASPVVISPIGMDGAIWPGATRILAATARDLGIAYMPSTMATASIEEVAGIAPDNAWFQLYAFADNDHDVSFDLVRRAEKAGAGVLALTVDIPSPPRRVRDMRNGLLPKMKLTPEKILAMLSRPAWLSAVAREGMPTLANIRPYCTPGAGRDELEAFVRNNKAGAGVTWDTVRRIRDLWKKPLLVKGIMHPADALEAVAAGVDGIVVSNHGGRQFDPSPATIDVLPAIRAAVGDKLTVLMDSGVMSGTDVVKAIACGADGVLVGRAFMYGLAALGTDGARHVAHILHEELRVALAQSGADTLEGARQLAVRHPGAWSLAEFGIQDV